MIRLSSRCFPLNARVQGDTGLPWGCAVMPFASMPSSSLSTEGDEYSDEVTDSAPSVSIDSIARCAKCFGYINPYVTFEGRDNKVWRCSLCRYHNTLPDRSRYSGMHQGIPPPPEMTNHAMEYDASSSPSPMSPPSSTSYAPHAAPEDPSSSSLAERTAYVIVVDLTGGDKYLDLVKSGVLAALEVLPRDTLVGLMVFGGEYIKMVDMRGPIPHMRNIRVGSSIEESVALGDVMSLHHFLIDLDTYETCIYAAIESIQHIVSRVLLSHPTLATSVGRPLGLAVQLLVEYLAEGAHELNARISLFLAGSPNLGPGAYSHTPSANLSADFTPTTNKLTPKTDFYQGVAMHAAEAWLSIDVYILCPPAEYVGIGSLKCLSALTGGTFLWYKDIDTATLPQDIYRQVTRPHAFHGVMRIRTSPEFAVSRVHGNIYVNPSYENLYHVQACDAFKSFAMEFQFAKNASFDATKNHLPTVQMAFAYTYFPRLVEDKSTPDHAPDRSLRPQRRLRVVTIQVPVAANVKEIYDTSEADVLLSLITPKIMNACKDEGIKEGRHLLQDWLTLVVSRYNEVCHVTPQVGTQAMPGSKNFVDTAFSQVPSLRVLPKLVYALLRSPLLQVAVSDDEWHEHQVMYAGITPRHLHRALHPMLSSYGAPNNLATSFLPLTRTSLHVSNQRVYLLDAFDRIIIFYDINASDVPFPPPRDSLIRTTVQQLKQDRHITPEVLMIKAATASTPGVGDDKAFLNYLIEDVPEGGAASVGEDGVGYARFMDRVAKEARNMMVASEDHGRTTIGGEPLRRQDSTTQSILALSGDFA